MAGQEVGLEPVKVFTDLSNKISATRSHFEEYSSGVSKLLKLKVTPTVLHEIFELSQSLLLPQPYCFCTRGTCPVR